MFPWGKKILFKYNNNYTNGSLNYRVTDLIEQCKIGAAIMTQVRVKYCWHMCPKGNKIARKHQKR